MFILGRWISRLGRSISRLRRSMSIFRGSISRSEGRCRGSEGRCRSPEPRPPARWARCFLAAARHRLPSFFAPLFRAVVGLDSSIDQIANTTWRARHLWVRTGRTTPPRRWQRQPDHRRPGRPLVRPARLLPRGSSGGRAGRRSGSSLRRAQSGASPR
jgi:hypothetical protein